MRRILLIWLSLLAGITGAFGQLPLTGVGPGGFGGAAAALALDGSASNTMTGSNSGTVTLTTTLSNDIIVLSLFNENNGGTNRHISGVSGGGLTWASRASTNGTDTGTSLDVWWAVAPSALAATVFTYTLDGVTDDAVVVAFGVNGSSNTAAPWDTNVSLPAANTTGTLSSPATVSGVSTTTTATMLIGVAGDGTTVSSHTYSPDTGFTTIAGIYNGGGSRAAAIGSQYKVVAAAQSGITVNSAISQNVRWTMVVDAIR